MTFDSPFSPSVSCDQRFLPWRVDAIEDAGAAERVDALADDGVAPRPVAALFVAQSHVVFVLPAHLAGLQFVADNQFLVLAPLLREGVVAGDGEGGQPGPLPRRHSSLGGWAFQSRARRTPCTTPSRSRPRNCG